MESMKHLGEALKLLKHRTHLVFSSNTSKGKTVICGGLILSDKDTRYVKVLQSGKPKDEDILKKLVKNGRLVSKTLFEWENPQSPHWCCIEEQKPVSENEVVSKLLENVGDGRTLIETSGGVLSPGPASSHHASYRHAGYKAKDKWGWRTQGDLYAGLGLPVLFIGDGELGGISATLSSIESLLIRGYDVDMIAMIQNDPKTDNTLPVREYLSERLFETRSGSGKVLFDNPDEDIVSLPPLPEEIRLEDWYSQKEVKQKFEQMNSTLNEKFKSEMSHKLDMLENGKNVIWWPFTQHAVEAKSPLLIDRASDNYYSMLSTNNNSKSITQNFLFDAPASWWTQGLGHGESSSSLAIGAAAGRYSHVLFPTLLHEPAVTLSKRLLDGPGQNWASRVFFSDDGSTAVEVGIKMGFRLFQNRFPSETKENRVLAAQRFCYHGDTLGAMNVGIPSTFNVDQHPWYQPKALFLDTPTVAFANGKLEINQEETYCRNIQDVYDIPTRLQKHSQLYDTYRNLIENQMNEYQSQNDCIIASTLIEPLLMGAGGMLFIDPLFQRALLDESKKKKIPIIYDEVFSGLYRLGPIASCASILGVNPDISCYSKLLTGGLVPLGATLATDEVFQAYLGDDKAKALLHGHSYSGYPIGCVSAIYALESLQNFFNTEEVSYFDQQHVLELSNLEIVQESFALGTVLAVKLHSERGYTLSTRARQVAQHLQKHGIYARPLGNVIYIMVTPFTPKEQCAQLSNSLEQSIRQVSKTL